MIKIKLTLLLLLCACASFAQKNLELIGRYRFAPDVFCAGLWHYNDTAGNEYALVGTSDGLTILDITDPANIQHLFDVPDSHSMWREVKTWEHYAYVSNEGSQQTDGGGGITIIDLSSLPDTPVYKKYTSDGPIAGTLSDVHTVQCVDGYLYVNGSNRRNGGTIIYSLADPWNPHYISAYSQRYVHDCFVRGNLLITSEIFSGDGFTIIDITDKSDPDPISSHDTPFEFNHNAWMSDDGNYLFTTDELNEAPLASYDISDPNDITGPLDLYLTNKNPIGEVHNVRVLNDFLVNACYGDAVHSGSQVTIVDASRPANLIEVGDYELSGKNTGGGLTISWDVDPYLPSGNLIATEGDSGFFVFAPTYRRACHVEGNVTDSITGLPINNAKVEILTTIGKDSTTFAGDYKTGVADSGVYIVQFTKAGYNTKSIEVILKNGVLTTLDVQLWNGLVGMPEVSSAPALLHVYPNPAGLEAQVSFDASLLSGTNIRLVITDVLGRTVRALSNIKESTVTLDRRDLANGSYTLQLISDDKKLAETTVIFQ